MPVRVQRGRGRLDEGRGPEPGGENILECLVFAFEEALTDFETHRSASLTDGDCEVYPRTAGSTFSSMSCKLSQANSGGVPPING